MKRFPFLLSILIVVMVMATACEKTLDEPSSTFNVRLASASSFAAEQVNVDITNIEVNYSGNTWQPLAASSGVYNLLDYTSSADTLVAKGAIAATTVVKQMRITFGTRNSLQVGGKSIPLVQGSSSKVLTLTVDRKLNRNIENVTVVIDPVASIRPLAEGGYVFAPTATIR